MQILRLCDDDSPKPAAHLGGGDTGSREEQPSLRRRTEGLTSKENGVDFFLFFAFSPLYLGALSLSLSTLVRGSRREVISCLTRGKEGDELTRSRLLKR